MLWVELHILPPDRPTTSGLLMMVCVSLIRSYLHFPMSLFPLFPYHFASSRQQWFYFFSICPCFSVCVCGGVVVVVWWWWWCPSIPLCHSIHYPFSIHSYISASPGQELRLSISSYLQFSILVRTWVRTPVVCLARHRPAQGSSTNQDWMARPPEAWPPDSRPRRPDTALLRHHGFFKTNLHSTTGLRLGSLELP